MNPLTRIGEERQRSSPGSAARAATKWPLPLFLAALTLAQLQAVNAATVRAQLEPGSLILGDSAELEIIVEDSTGGTVSADIPQIDGLEIRRSGTSWRFENGRRSDILNFTVAPSREGKFIIPPIAVKVDGQALRTNQLVLSVGKTPESTEMRLVVSVSKRECYTLEPVEVAFDWYVPPYVTRPELDIPLLQDKDELSLKVVPSPSTAPNSRIVANRYELLATRSQKEVNGIAYTVLSLSFRIFPPQPGRYAIRPATVRAYVQSGYKIETDDFLPIRRRVPNFRRVFAASEPVELIVKSLPEAGKPAGFTGAVGKLSISLETADTQVKVGDPILLKMNISGTALLEKINRPLLSQDAAFARDFSVNESLAPGDISGDRVTFEQTIRAKSESVKQIPSFSFPYFNPDPGAYEIATSKPIPITVVPTTEITAEDIVKFGPETPRGGTTTLEEQPGGILANYTHLDALHNQAVNWWLLSFLGLPPATYAAVLLIVSRRRKLAGDLALARSKSAKRVLKRNLTEAKRHLQQDDRQFYDSLARAVTRFTSDKLNLGMGELTAYDVETLARQNKIDAESSRKIAEILARCDAGRFAPASESALERMDLLRRAEELTRTLGKTL